MSRNYCEVPAVTLARPQILANQEGLGCPRQACEAGITPVTAAKSHTAKMDLGKHTGGLQRGASGRSAQVEAFSQG